MMRYESAKTSSGNIGMSYTSQAEADANAAAMDAGNNFNCYNCSDCSGCSRCYNCYNCSGCSHCSNCYNCSNCYKCSNCSDCSDCSDCSRCFSCSHCYKCYNCSRCSDCSGALIWRGSQAEKLLTINGLKWPVATSGTHIQIGCQQHTVEEWESFDDARIADMAGGALDFWREFKPTIMAMAAHRRGLKMAKAE